MPLSVPTLGYSPGTSTYLALVLALLQLTVVWHGDKRTGALLHHAPELARKTLDLAAAPAEALAHRIAVPKQFSGKVLVDDDNGRRDRLIRLGEETTRQ